MTTDRKEGRIEGSWLVNAEWEWQLHKLASMAIKNFS